MSKTTHERSKQHCCLCSAPLASRGLFEDRPSGESGKTERWYFCLTCYPSHKSATEPRPNEFVQYRQETIFPKSV